MALLTYTKNDHYWNEPNIENSYFAGFIAADGNIYNKRHCVLQFGLKRSDEVQLQKIKTVLNYTSPLRYYTTIPYF